MNQENKNGNGKSIFGGIDNEEALEPKPTVIINPTPQGGHCECCGRHVSELKPFGGPGDDLPWEEFTGAYLVSNWRPEFPYSEEVEQAFEEAEQCYKKDGFNNPCEWLIDKYGEEEADQICLRSQGQNLFGSSWECRDCILLDTDEYFGKKWGWA